jgi:hypothetical protein
MMKFFWQEFRMGSSQSVMAGKPPCQLVLELSELVKVE